MTQDLRQLPAIRALAEERAAAVQNAIARRSYIASWADKPSVERDIRIDAHLDLLCDTSRQASRDDLAALIAKAIGWHRSDVTGAIECCSDYVRFRRLMADRYDVELPQDWQQVDAADAITALALAVLA